MFILFVLFFHLDEKTKLQEEKNPHEQQIKYFGKVRKNVLPSLKHLYLSVFVLLYCFYVMVDFYIYYKYSITMEQECFFGFFE